MKPTYTKNTSPQMFDLIASTYDRVNRLMTFGLDISWRKILFRFLPENTQSLLDGATGTADQILGLIKQGCKAKRIVGIDLSENMLEIGRKKTQNCPQVSLIKGDLLKIPFEESSFDAVTIAFGVRNVSDLSVCLKEVHRVLKQGGRCLILESSLPQNKLVAFLHRWYLAKLMPKIGGVLSKQKEAYEYLNATTQAFPSGKAFVHKLQEAGFVEVSAYPLSFGVVHLYVATKRDP